VNVLPRIKKKKESKFLPKLKKNISAFAKGESGKISKQSMLTVGSIVGGAAVGVAISSKSVKGGHAWIFQQNKGAGLNPSINSGGVFGSGGKTSGSNITYVKIGDKYNVTITIDPNTGKITGNKSY